MPLLIIALILFIIADIAIRTIAKKINEKKTAKEREEALAVSLKLDFTMEAKTLRRAEVQNPKARILCVDDEEVILDSFRKILVLDGYCVDTVQNGKEALGLIQSHHYDFVFTDLKMPEMDGVDVVKSVKHMRPDIDVIVITGYATVETAVECMKFGAVDYVQKPFTEDELLAFVKKILIRRNDMIQKRLKPKVHITHTPGAEYFRTGEFAIPGGVFISLGHCWMSMDQEGTVKVGMDDFAKKLIGKIDGLELPNLGMAVKKGQPLFSIRKGQRAVPFLSPVSGKVTKVNSPLTQDLERLDITPYDRNWICCIDSENLDNEIKELKIGNAAIILYEADIQRFLQSIKEMLGEPAESHELYVGEIEKVNDSDWNKVINDFFKK